METYTLVALVVAALVVAAVLVVPPRRTASPSLPPRRAGKAGRQFIELGREIGLDAAGLIVEQRLGQTEADEHLGRIVRAFAPAPPAPAPTTSPN